MRIAIFGLGYVGSVSAACFAKRGHTVLGVEPNELKRRQVRAGLSPIVEPGLDALLLDVVRAGKLTVAESAEEAVGNSDIAFLCVPTPSTGAGGMDSSYIRRAVAEIGSALRGGTSRYTVVIRSTVEPGTTQDLVMPLLAQESGRRIGVEIVAAMNPEFLREGTAIADFESPFATVIGASDNETAAHVADVYRDLRAPIVQVAVREAEMVKYACNAFHAVKVAFANEIGALCAAHGIDGTRVMDVFCQDRRLNLSAKYLRPGFAFGGSCLPKDVRALVSLARRNGLDVPLTESLLPSNRRHVERAVALIRDTGAYRVLVLGLSFKWQTDDLRESPTVDLVETLIGKGIAVAIHDPSVLSSRLVGSNQSYISARLPHLDQLLSEDLDGLIRDATTVVLASHHPVHLAAVNGLRADQVLVDLVGATAASSGRARRFSLNDGTTLAEVEAGLRA